MIGLAIDMRNHAHDFFAAQLGAERAADAAIGAGRDHAALSLTLFDQRFFEQGRSRAGLHAGAAGHALGGEKRFILAGDDTRIETAPFDGQRKRALHFVTGTHAARTDNALGGIEAKIWIRCIAGDQARIGNAVLIGGEMIGAIEPVAIAFEADHGRHFLHFTTSARCAADAIGWMIGNIEFHNATPDFAELRALRTDLHALGNRRRARSRIAFHAFDLHQTEAARSERSQRIGRTQSRDVDAVGRRRAHDRRAGGNAHRHAVDFKAHRFQRFQRMDGRRAVVDVIN